MLYRSVAILSISALLLSSAPARADEDAASTADDDCICTYDSTTYADDERCEWHGQRMRECPAHLPPNKRFTRSKAETMSFWLRASGGTRYADRRDPARFGRAELEFDFTHVVRKPSFVGSILIGLEGYQGKHQGFSENGIGMPWSVQFGWRTPTLVMGGGFGLDVLSIDHLQGGNDVGILTPFASAYAGLDLDGVRILGMTHQEWRWHAVNDTSRWVVSLGLALSIRFAEDVI